MYNVTTAPSQMKELGDGAAVSYHHNKKSMLRWAYGTSIRFQYMSVYKGVLVKVTAGIDRSIGGVEKRDVYH